MNVKYERQLKKGVLEIIVLQLLIKRKNVWLSIDYDYERIKSRHV